tara:strand:- start:296 stop:826 length:531 start_codon:yes stop_codon:yes gene_type:complete
MGKHLIDLSKCKNYCFWDEEAQAIAVFCQGKDKLYNGFFFCGVEAIHLLKRNKWYIENKGYAVGSFDNKVRKFHREILNFPKMVDHCNRNRLDNRVTNLRETDYFKNNHNSRTRANNTSGYSGVSFSRGKWIVRIPINGKRTYFGSFTSKATAILVRKKAEKKVFKEFAPNHKEYY